MLFSTIQTINAFNSSCISLQNTMTEARRKRFEEVLSKRQTDLTVVLENVFDPHNISAIMRNCDAVGVAEIFVLNTKLPLHKEWGFKSSRSALKWVEVHQFTDIDACMYAVKQKYKRVLSTHLSAQAVSLFQQDLTEPVAVVFGNEQHGISDELLQWSDGNIIIPQVGMLHSLNISVACAVVLYETLRQRTEAGHYAKQKLSETSFSKLFKQWSGNAEDD